MLKLLGFAILASIISPYQIAHLFEVVTPAKAVVMTGLAVVITEPVVAMTEIVVVRSAKANVCCNCNPD